MHTGVKVPCLNRLAIPLCCRSFPAVIERKDDDHAAFAVATGAGVEPDFQRFRKTSRLLRMSYLPDNGQPEGTLTLTLCNEELHCCSSSQPPKV